MPLTLAEYSDLLDARRLIWPRVPSAVSVRATPFLNPLPGIRAVLWDVYGTLLRVSDGRFLVYPENEVPVQVALEKTIHEFSLWQAMHRKPGPPWQSMIGQYRNITDRLAMDATQRRGDFIDVDLNEVWREIIDKLRQREYQHDASVYGDEHEFVEKVAFFFHSCLQGIEARPGAARAMSDLAAVGIHQGLLADGQSFTLVQMLRALAHQGSLPPLHELFRAELLILSSQLGIRKPSITLFEYAVSQLRAAGISPTETLHVSCRLKTDLAPAKSVGMKTALLVAEKAGLEAPPELLKDRATRPDRLLTDLSQLASIIGGIP